MNKFALTVLAVAGSIAALGQTTGTATLNAGQSFSFDSNGTVSSGGDISFTGTALNFVGSAKGGSLAALGFTGSSGYSTVSLTILQALASFATATPIPIASLSVNTVLGIDSNAGNGVKVLITSVSASSLGFQYTTYSASSTGPTGPTGPTSSGPSITAVLNNYSLVPNGLPNSGIAPSTIFIIQGTGLASIPISQATLQSSSGAGIPKTLNGASVSVKVGSSTVTPGLYYAGATQIAAVLPASTPTGSGTITVSYNNGTSNSFAITVVPTALGLDSYYGNGSGLGVATDAVTGALITYTNSAKPGESIVLWGSGLGADTADSDVAFTSSPHAVNQPLTFFIGGVQVNPAYAGSSGYPGLNQVNITLPASVPTGCGISFIGQIGNLVTNSIQLPIATGGGVCVDTVLGYNGTQLVSQTTTTGAYTTASAILEQGTNPSTGLATIGEASFMKYSAGTTTITGASALSLGSCALTLALNVSASTTVTSTGLDAGNISIAGPTGSQSLPQFTNPITGPIVGTYIATAIPNSFLPSGGGTFTVSGTGGKDVGAFTSSISLGPLLNWTNQSSSGTVTRSSGIPVTWTGGSGYVYIGGTSSSSTGGPTASFVCYAPASAGSFTVPSYIADALPAGSGSLGITNAATPGVINASGLTSPGAFIGAVSYTINATYK